MKDRAKKIKWLFTDVDGVLTDCGVYYSENGEELKRFSLRDGMGAERLRKFTNIQIAIMTGENSGPVSRRAEKLKIEKVFLGVKDKLSVMKQFLLRII
jgi:3-deoxy-D-manno-octulosonate 8-phosphate phosphatase (KDO 8-P phosphatase)